MAYSEPTPGPDRDWQARCDHDSLMKAAEIMADKARMNGVMRHMNKTRQAARTLKALLARNKTRAYSDEDED